jgi:hypothetical protein
LPPKHSLPRPWWISHWNFESLPIPANPSFFRVLLFNCYGWSVG